MADETPDREPGAPVPKDAIDPELVNLRPRTQVGLVTAAAVVLFCISLSVKLWPDFQYAGEGKAREVTVADIAAGKVGDESHVTVPGALERAAAVRVRQSKGVQGLRVVPMAGGGDGVWVVIDGDGWADPRTGDAYTGRLRRLSELPFESAFRAQVRANPEARYVTTEELRRARMTGSGAGTVTAFTGDVFQVGDADVVEIVVPDPDEVTVIGSFDTYRPDAESYTKSLAAAGIIDPTQQPTKTQGQQVWFDIKRKDALAQTDKLLVANHFYGAKVEPLIRRNRAAWKDLAVDDAGVTVDGSRVPWGTFQVAAIHSARPLPGDPWVVLVGETPDRYWYVRPLYGLLGVFAVLFTWALVRTARRELLSPKVPARA